MYYCSKSITGVWDAQRIARASEHTTQWARKRAQKVGQLNMPRGSNISASNTRSQVLHPKISYVEPNGRGGVGGNSPLHSSLSSSLKKAHMDSSSGSCPKRNLLGERLLGGIDWGDTRKVE